MSDLVIALDMPDAGRALTLVKLLDGAVKWFKIGLELFVGAGPDLVEELKARDLRIFLDLKFYDIPNTVAGATLAAAALKVDMLTLHCQGGARMCEVARNALAGLPQEERPLLFGVTALTSFAPGEMPGIRQEPGDFGLALAHSAKDWGLDGVVCSGREVEGIKKSLPGLLCLCPGIRPAGSGAQDQRRTMTPAEAVAAGADFLVLGRPVTRACDPFAAACAILEEMKAKNVPQARTGV